MANKPKKSRTIDTKKVSGFDVCQTPPHALEPLYPYLHKDWIIWESACGPEQLLVHTLRAQGYTVQATDLLMGYNRFSYNPIVYDIELTNMPFSIKYKWLEQAFNDGKRFALLAPYETPAAAAFQKLFARYNGKPWQIEILAPQRRINYKMPNKGWDSSAQMPTCWITWGLEVHQTKTVDDVLMTFYVPMRSAKYDEDNKEIT
jgi:hypothetical protein